MKGTTLFFNNLLAGLLILISRGLFFLKRTNFYSYEIEYRVQPRTHKERKQRTTKLALSIFNLKIATEDDHHWSSRTPSPEALTSRSDHQLRGAGSGDEDRASAGGTPRAHAAPDLGPTPQINHLLTTNLQSRRLGSPPPVLDTAPDPPPAQIRRENEEHEHHAGPRSSASRARRRRAPKSSAAGEGRVDRKTPTASPTSSLAPPARSPSYPTICTCRNRGSPTLPPPERPAEEGNPAAHRRARGGSAGVTQKTPLSLCYSDGRG
jgi:hypothetical protein